MQAAHAFHRPASAVCGVLKGFDQLQNIVLAEAIEYMRGESGERRRPRACAVLHGDQRFSPFFPADPDDPDCTTERTRPLGIVVCRGPTIMAVAPEEAYAEIANPFESGEEGGAEAAEAAEAEGAAADA